METNLEKATVFVKENQEKFKSPMFVASGIVFIAYFLFWGITDKGYFSGIIAFVNIIDDYRLFIGYNGEMSLTFYYYLLALTLNPISSGYLLYSSWVDQARFVKLAKILLLISLLPFALQGIFRPIKTFGLFLSVLSLAYIFFPKIGNQAIEKVKEFIKEQKNKPAN